MSFEANQSIITFTKILCGKYSNKKQAYNNPRLYAHINIYFRLLPWSLLKGISIYSEQSYNHLPWSPYRQAVHRILSRNNLLILENYKLKNSKRIAGAGFTMNLLEEIKRDDLILRENCQMNFLKLKKGIYTGKLDQEKKCIINRDGDNTYLISKVEVSKDKFTSIDEGFDINTNKKVWGSDFGALSFDRVL